MGTRYYKQVQKHFRFLIDEYGFSVEKEEEGRGYCLVAFRQKGLFRPKICRVRVSREAGRVQVDIAPLSAPNDWFSLATVIQYLTPGAENPWTYDEVYDPKTGKQLENLAEVLRSHFDTILQLFQKSTFKQKREELIAHRRKREAAALARMEGKPQG